LSISDFSFVVWVLNQLRGKRGLGMNYLLFICADGMPAPDELAVMQRECPGWVDEMDGRGVRLLGRELDLPETAATVRVRDGEPLVTDGPFAETKEFIAGFDLLECADLDEALEVAAKHPSSWFAAIEVRPVKGEARLGEKASAFGRADDSAGTSYMLAGWVGGASASDQIDEVNAWRQDVEARGLHVLANALEGADTATTVRVRNGQTLLSDGPATPIEEFVACLDVVSCADRQQAVDLAAAHPVARHHAIEVRPFYSE
jgi:hypothetical protein